MDNTASTIPEPPTPQDPRTIARWKHTRRRRKLLYGDWLDLLNDSLKVAIGDVRKAAWGIPDGSSNVFAQSTRAVAVLYDRPPEARHKETERGAPLLEAIDRSGLWEMMQCVQRDTIGMREMFLRVDVDGEGDAAELVFTPVPPDLIDARATAARPEEPVWIREAVLRWKDGEPFWTWDEYDIRDAGAPTFRILAADGKEDVTAAWLTPEEVAAGYYWLDENDAPFLPYSIYHARKTGQLFDAWDGSEIVEGTLNVAVLLTFFLHAVKFGSWPQRWIAGARIAGEQLAEDDEGEGQRREIIVDPAVILELEPHEPGIPVQTGQWAVSIDTKDLQEAIALYERRVAASGGINPADIQRVAGDARGGYAIAITYEAQRAAARRFAPTFARSDERTLRLAGLLWNLATGADVPTTGWRVTYAAVPPSVEEQAAERQHMVELLSHNLISRVEVYMRLNPGVDEAGAVEALARIAKVNAETSKPAPKDPPAPDTGADDDTDTDAADQVA